MCYIIVSHQLFVLYMTVYMSQFYCLNSSHSLLPPLCLQVHFPCRHLLYSGPENTVIQWSLEEASPRSFHGSCLQFDQAAITIYHSLRDLNNMHLFLMVLESDKPQIQVLRDSVPGEGPLPECRQPSSHCIGRSGISFQNGCSTHMTSSKPNQLPKAPSCNRELEFQHMSFEKDTNLAHNRPHSYILLHHIFIEVQLI